MTEKTASKEEAKKEKILGIKQIMGRMKSPIQETILYAIMGVVEKSKTKMGNYGEWARLIGSFEAIRFIDRKRFVGAAAVVPPSLHRRLQQALQAAQKEKPESHIKFVCVISIRPANNSTGYEYLVEYTNTPDVVDELSTLRLVAQDRLTELTVPAG